MKRIYYTILEWIMLGFGRPSFTLYREGFWWSDDINKWHENPFQDKVLVKFSWSSCKHYFKDNENPFEDFGESVDKGIPATLTEYRVLFGKRWSWNFVAEEQEGFGEKK